MELIKCLILQSRPGLTSKREATEAFPLVGGLGGLSIEIVRRLLNLAAYVAQTSMLKLHHDSCFDLWIPCFKWLYIYLRKRNNIPKISLAARLTYVDPYDKKGSVYVTPCALELIAAIDLL